MISVADDWWDTLELIGFCTLSPFIQSRIHSVTSHCKFTVRALLKKRLNHSLIDVGIKAADSAAVIFKDETTNLHTDIHTHNDHMTACIFLSQEPEMYQVLLPSLSEGKCQIATF